MASETRSGFAAQVHRFRDTVAVYVRGEGAQGGATAYLSADEARDMGRALLAAARDVEARSFALSSFATWERSREGEPARRVRIEGLCGRVVAQGRNLRVFYDYARRVPCDPTGQRAGFRGLWASVTSVHVTRASGAQGAGEARVVVRFADGAQGACPFASRDVALAWGASFARKRGGTFAHDFTPREAAPIT